jgi:hypothetical protein
MDTAGVGRRARFERVRHLPDARHLRVTPDTGTDLAIGQIGTTIGLGLLFDTLVVRSLMTPTIAALLGRWLWWLLRAPQPTDADRSAGTATDGSQTMRAIMSVSGAALLGIMVVGSGVAVAWPAHADPDTDFANELHTYGIYGQKDYNAWIGKITCKRLYNGVDADADKSAKFVFLQMPKGSSTEQAWQFLGAAITTYCPDQTPVLQRAAEQR